MQTPDPESTKDETTRLDEREIQTLDRIPECCFLLAADWTITHINPAAERLVGRSLNTVLGQNFRVAFPDETGGALRSACHRAMEERVDVEAEGYSTCLQSWFTVHARPWGTGLAVFFRDTARERHVWEQVLESEAQLRDFVESATDLIHMLAPDGRILYANRAWRETLGYTQEEITRLSMLDVVAPDSRETAAESLRRTLAGEQTEIEVAVLAKDGRRIIVRGHANSRFVNGAAVGTRGIYRDVTAELETAERLRKAQRIEASAMRAKTAFLDRVSHELRTPLASVIGFADILLQNRSGHLTQTEVMYATRIAAQGRNLLTLVEDVLEYAEIEARSLDLELTTVDVAAMVREVVALQMASQPQRGAIDITVEGPLSAMLATDRATLRRIFRYILDDAIKRDRSGRMAVRVLVDPQSGYASALEVIDTPAATAPSMGDAELEDPHVALALGLTVARSLCQVLGCGFVTETNELGVTTRRIDLRGASHSNQRSVDEMATTLHAFLESSPLPIVTFDPDWTVRVWNDAAHRLFGWTQDEAVGKRLPILRAEDEHSFRELLREALKSPTGIADIPATHVRRNGLSVEVRASIAPLRAQDGRLLGFISILADVSDRMRLESELRQAHKMEVVGRLAGGIVHDFNNLLTIISAHSQFLVGDLAVDDERRSDAVAIRDVVDRASDLTQNLLLFARKEAPQQRVVDLNVVVASAERILRRTLGSHVTLITDRNAEELYTRANPAELEQVIMNLALNARDAMPNGGTLELRTSIKPAEGGKPACAILWVKDTGVGMDDATRDHLFEPFFTTKAKGKGTGLGLATVYTIVKGAGGSISVDTELGKGTTVTVEFPFVTPDAGTEAIG